MSILIVDDHEVVRHGLRSALSAKGYVIVGDASTGAVALALASGLAPDVAIVDLRLPDMRGDELCRQLLNALPEVAVIMLTTYVSDETLREAFHAGAAAYVTKATGLPELITVLEKVCAPGPRPLAVQLRSLVATQEERVSLTPRQESVLELAARGLTNHQIGSRLYLSESTVRFHIQKLKRQFGARTKTQLIAVAIRKGAIAPAPEASDQG